MHDGRVAGSSKGRSPAQLGNVVCLDDGKATNEEEPRDTNFPGFTRGWLPIKANARPPYFVRFSDTAKCPFARTKSRPRDGNVVSRLDRLVSDDTRTKKGERNARICRQSTRNRYPGHTSRSRDKETGGKEDEGGFATLTAEGIGRDSRQS